MTAKREPHILVVDDDVEIRNLLGKYLAAQDFRVSLAADLKSFRKAVATNTIHLAVLDVMLPDGSGLDMCRELRAQKSALPKPLFTALKEDVDRIIGLEFGADDYLGKPLNPRELVARIRTVLRRQQDVAATPKEVERKTDEFVRLDKSVIAVVEELTAAGLPIELVGSAPVVIRAAPLAIIRVLRNLLTNAATHGRGCTVSVEVQQQWAVVAIEDDGPGIPEAVIDRVFEPFFRVDPARQQSIAGAGLGLAIAREIVGRYEGEIVLTNRKAGGLRQEIRLPSHVVAMQTLAGVA